MELREALRSAIATLRAHKMRSLLTALGIIIGVSAVIGLLAIVNGIRASVDKQFSSLGAQLISVNRSSWSVNEDMEEVQKRKPLTLRDYETVRDLAAVQTAAPTVYTGRDIVYRGTEAPAVTVCGTSETYPAIEDWKIEDGRFLSDDDVHASREVVVLGADVVKALFPDGVALGNEVRVGGHALTVIGTLERKGNFFGQSQDNLALVPYSAFAKHWGIAPRRDVNISALAANGYSMDEAVDEIRVNLRRARRVPEGKPEDFAVNTSSGMTAQFNQVTSGVFMIMILIGGMSLVVGGIGIMNIMLVSVTERTREIGLRKAVGARRRDVVRQFLIEAVILCLAGGGIGVALGCGAGALVAAATPLAARVTPGSIVLGFGVSTVVGLTFGIWPAVRASRLDPVVALRSE